MKWTSSKSSTVICSLLKCTNKLYHESNQICFRILNSEAQLSGVENQLIRRQIFENWKYEFSLQVIYFGEKEIEFSLKYLPLLLRLHFSLAWSSFEKIFAVNLIPNHPGQVVKKKNIKSNSVQMSPTEEKPTAHGIWHWLLYEFSLLSFCFISSSSSRCCF